MKQTIAEKILSGHSGKRVTAGDICIADVDLIMAQDGTAPLAIKAFEKMEGKNVKHPENVVFVIDHNSPSPNIGVSQLHQLMRNFVKKQGINFSDVGNGVCHIVLPENGYVKPGGLIIGADSHTPTYGALNSFAVGMGSTDIAAGLYTGKLWFRVPETIKIILKGKLPQGVFAKDVALFLIGKLRADGANYKMIELKGEIGLLPEPDELKEILKSWKKKQIADKFKTPLFNFIMSKCNIKALGLEDELNLPLHIPMPKLSPKNQETQ